MTKTVTAWTLSQAVSLETASNLGNGWTSADLEFVSAFEDASTMELALALNRSIYSITSIKQAINNGREAGSNRVRVTRVETGYDFVNSFPVGWND